VNLRPAALVALSALGGCAFAVEDAGDGPQLLVPDDIELHWSAAFNGTDDGRVALVPVDVMIYDGATGAPLGDVDLDVQVLAGDAYVVAPESVLPVDPTDAGAPDVVWDAWRDRYFAHTESRAGASRARTDATGLARLYLEADAFPVDSGDADTAVFNAIPVVVSMGITDDTFLLVPR
jgi:hypothetical protein